MEAIQRMDECDLVLSVEDGEYIHQHILASLSFWQAQSQSCHAAKVLRWKFRPKHHYMEKIGDFAQRARINPRHVSCFQDESFLGHIRNIAVRTHPSTCLLRIFQRLMLNLGQRFEDTRENAKSALSSGRVVPQRKKRLVQQLPNWLSLGHRPAVLQKENVQREASLADGWWILASISQCWLNWHVVSSKNPGFHGKPFELLTGPSIQIFRD